MTLFKKALVCVAMSLAPAAHAAAKELSPPPLSSNDAPFIEIRPVATAPDTEIRTLDGKSIHLGRFRGRVVVLNFWATWCPPCIYEMPSLDRLAANANTSDLAVIAVSIDRTGALAVTPFLSSHRITHLQVALDPDQRLGTLNLDDSSGGTLPLWSLPISYIIDRQGHVLGYVSGAVKWDSPQAQSFVSYFETRAP